MTIAKVNFSSHFAKDYFMKLLLPFVDKTKKIKTSCNLGEDCIYRIKIYFNLPYNEAYDIVYKCLRQAVTEWSSSYEIKIKEVKWSV